MYPDFLINPTSSASSSAAASAIQTAPASSAQRKRCLAESSAQDYSPADDALANQLLDQAAGYYSRGFTAKAKELLEQAKAISPNNPKVHAIFNQYL